MPLLLAIEPDAHQAISLTTCVSTHLSAELVVAATVPEALTRLQPRRPDLVLASPSVGPAERAALMTGLGAELPVLAIPLLTTQTGTPRRARGLLSRLRRSRRRREADACEPSAFAAQIAECLGLADAVRRAYAQATANPPAGTPMLSAADAEATVIDLQVFAERERAEEPAVADGWLDLEPYLADEGPGAAGPGGPVRDGPPEPDVIELPPPGELWAQLAPGYAARMAPLEGPPMAPGPQQAAPRAASADLEGPETAGSLPSLPSRAASDRPMQDEWGLYDPEQCGFAALRLRLAELADDDRREREPDDRSAIMRP